MRIAIVDESATRAAVIREGLDAFDDCEIFVVPMIFGFWQISAIWGLLNIGILAFRIHEEDLALSDRRETSG